MDRDRGTTYVSKEEEGQQEGEAPPHPGLEALCRDHNQDRDDPITQAQVKRKGLCPSSSPVRIPERGGHARLTHSEVHGVPLAQGPQAVQTAALVVILEELHEAWRAGGHQDWAGVPSLFPAPPRGGRSQAQQDL